ncbi:MAG: leucine-rich repeat domain-containing protein, partial [Clostridia bacterium]|nr:leucine-rich repeat domain-containing protein [Clostridia bacterium]
PKRVKRIAIISVSLLISLAVIIAASLMLIAPIKYSIAENHYENGNLEKAAELFSEIPDYKNSRDILSEIYATFSEKEGKIISCSALEPWFSINENGVISFVRSKYSGVGNITIPDVFDGITVKTVASNAFKNYINLKTVTLPSDLSSIGTYAFYGCKNLESINIPESVTSISPYAFKDCASLKTINIPDNLTVINAFVFSGCESLEFPTLPDTITKIDSSAFMGCTSFKDVVLPENIKTVGAFAFSACSNLKSVNIPVTLKEIGKNAFYQCESLSSVFYLGNEEEFKKISVDSGNEALTKAEVNYVH